MAVKIQAHYDGKTFVPDEPVDLQVGEKVQVIAEPPTIGKRAPTIEERRAALKRIVSRAVPANIPLEALRRENMYEDRL